MTGLNESRYPFQKGLLDLGGGLYTFQSGSDAFGLSNAGLVTSKDETLVIDTLYDLTHAQEMVDSITPVTASAPVRYVFNTHSDGDHIFGNQLFPDDAEIVATEAASALMTQDQADLTASLFDDSQHPDSPLHPLAAMGLSQPFDFHPIVVRPADATFSGERSLRVGELDVELHELGPAHTVGDAIAFVPEHGVLFAGDLLTHNIVKIVWSGSIANWITALDRIRAFDAEVIVAGHGPVLSGDGINAALDRNREFWSYLHEEAYALFDRGIPVDEAAAHIDVNDYPDVVPTLPTIIAAIYHERDAEVPYQTLPETFASIATQITELMRRYS